MPFPGIWDGLAAPVDMVSPTPERSSHFHLQDTVWLTLL